ncbi:hypothetical protein ACFFRR_008008 [Megaselia abdita]
MARCDSYFYKPEILDKTIRMDKDTQTNEEEFFKSECSEHKMQFKFQNEAHLKFFEQHMKNRCRICMKQSGNLKNSLSEHSRMELKACLAFLMSSLDFSENMCEGCTHVLSTVKIWIFHWSNSEKLFVHLKDAAKEFRKNHTISKNEHGKVEDLKLVRNESMYQAFQRLEIKPNEERIEASAHTKFRRRSAYVPKKITNLSMVEQFMVTKFTHLRNHSKHNEAPSKTVPLKVNNRAPKRSINRAVPTKAKLKELKPIKVKEVKNVKPKVTPKPSPMPILLLANPSSKSPETLTISKEQFRTKSNHWCKPIKKVSQSPDQSTDDSRRLVVSSPRTPTIQMNSIPVYQVNLNCIQNQKTDSPSPLIIIKSPSDLNSQSSISEILKIYDPSKSLEALSKQSVNVDLSIKRKSENPGTSPKTKKRRKSMGVLKLEGKEITKKSETPPPRRVTRSMSVYKPTSELAKPLEEPNDWSGSEVEWNPNDDLDNIWVKEYAPSMKRCKEMGKFDKEELQFLGFDDPVWKNNSRRKSVLLS